MPVTKDSPFFTTPPLTVRRANISGKGVKIDPRGEAIYTIALDVEKGSAVQKELGKVLGEYWNSCRETMDLQEKPKPQNVSCLKTIPFTEGDFYCFSGKQKVSKVVEREGEHQLPMYDGKGKRVYSLPKGQSLGQGSVVKIKGGFFASIVKQAKDDQGRPQPPKEYLSFYFNSVQILKFVPYTGNFGFDAVEDSWESEEDTFESREASPKKPEAQSFEDASDDDDGIPF